mgnify:CR=1 FL=1
MKRLKVCILYLMLGAGLMGQSNIRLNNYWSDMHGISPAWIYDKYKAVFNLSARKQWLGVEGSPATVFASGSTYLEDYERQLGLSVLQDKIGYTSLTNINLSYAYAVTLDYLWQMHLGVGGNYQMVGYDASKIITESDVDPILYSRLNSTGAFDADLGLEFSSKLWKIGASSQNLIAAFDKQQALQTNTNFLYSRYRTDYMGLFNWSAGLCGIQYANIYQAELNFTGYFKYSLNNGLTDKPDLFDIGVFYRTRSQAGMIFGINVSEDLHVAYSYDYHFGSLRRGNYGTNEITLTYNLQRRPICHNCWYE